MKEKKIFLNYLIILAYLLGTFDAPVVHYSHVSNASWKDMKSRGISQHLIPGLKIAVKFHMKICLKIAIFNLNLDRAKEDPFEGIMLGVLLFVFDLCSQCIERNPGPVSEICPGRPFIDNVPDLGSFNLKFEENFISISMESDDDGILEQMTFTEAKHTRVFNTNEVHIPSEMYSKIPHNLCLSLLNTNYTEGEIRMENGQTPDYVRMGDSGRIVLDVKTLNTRKTEDLRNACENLSSKYSTLADPQNIICIAVGLETVVSSNIDLEDNFKDALLKIFKIGRRFVELAETHYNFESPNLARNDAAMHIEQVDLIEGYSKIIDHRLLITREKMKKWKTLVDDTTCHELVTRFEEEGKHQTFKEYFSALPGKVLEKNSFVHVPLIIPERWSPESSDTCPLYFDAPLICSNMLDLWSQTYVPNNLNEGFEYLRVYRQENLTKEEKEERVNLMTKLVSHEFEIELAKRGVDGKFIRKKFPEMVPEDKMKLGLSGDFDLTRLNIWRDDFEIEFSENDFPLTEADLLKSGDKNMIETYKCMWNTNLLKAAVILDLIVRELIVNQTKNIKRKKLGEKTFIVTQIKDLDLYLMIKPTSMKGNKPIFFSILYRGSSLEQLGVFKKFTELEGGWKYCDFISMDADRLSNLVNIPCNILNLWALCKEKLGGGIDYIETLESLKKVSPATKMLTVLLIEDKEDVSTSHQLLRYFYMKAISSRGFYKMDPEAITEKFPKIIRSPILLFTLKGLKLERGAFVESKSEKNDIESFKFISNETPFGFSVEKPDDLVLVAYVCMLHNKDEGDDTLGSFQCVTKLLKMEYKLADKLKDPSYNPECREPKGFYEFSPNAVVFGAKLVMSSLVSTSDAVVKNDFPEISLDCLSEIVNAKVSDLATTKSTTKSIYEGELEHDANNKLTGIPNRTKCFVMVWGLMGKLFLFCQLFKNLFSVCSEVSSQLYVMVSLFKKNQIGGVREISILDIISRTHVFFLEGIARGFCGMLEEECLTKPKEKNRFMQKHRSKISKRSRAPGEGFVTLRISSDMTTWCQCFLMPMFACMYSVLLPAWMWNLASNVLNSMQSKKVELPKALLKKFMRSEDCSEDPNTERLRKEFSGESEPTLMKKSGAYIMLVGNMLQGILHYTSSLYHVCMLKYFCHFVTIYFKVQGHDTIISFQTSSDDEGVLITIFFQEKSLFRKNLKGYVENVIRIKDSVDRKFGLKTSWVKSTVTLLPLYEFNSVFFFGNSLIHALLKTVARSCDDPVEDSLHKRVCNMLSSLQAVRDQGASGALCQIVNISQTIALQRNLGRGVWSWWDKDAEEFFREIPLTINGYYPVAPMISAGFLDANFINYSSIPDGDSVISSLCLLFCLFNSEQVELEDTYKTKFTTWNSDKHKECMEKLGINPNSELSLEDFKILMRKPDTIEEYKIHLENTIRSKSIARSFARLKRSDMVRASVYYFWKNNIGKVGDSFHSRIHLQSLKSCLKKEKDAKSWFVDRTYYDALLFEHKKCVNYYKSKRYPVREVSVYSYRPTSSNFSRSKLTLSNFWFEERVQMSQTEVNLRFHTLAKELPWLRNTLDETLKLAIFDGDLRKLLVTINSLKIFRTLHLTYARKTEPNNRFYSSLSVFNTVTGFERIIETQKYKRTSETSKDACMLLKRLFAKLNSLIHNPDRKCLDYLDRELKSGLLRFIFTTEDVEPEWLSRDDTLNIMLTYRKIIKEQDNFNPEAVLKMIEMTKGTIWTKQAQFSKGKYMGEGICYTYSDEHGWMMKKFVNNDVHTVVHQRGVYRGLQNSKKDENIRNKFATMLIGSYPEIVATKTGIRLAFGVLEENEKLRHVEQIDGVSDSGIIGKRNTVDVENRTLFHKMYYGPRVPLEQSSCNQGPGNSTIGRWLNNSKLKLVDTIPVDEPTTMISNQMQERVIELIKMNSAKREEKIEDVQELKVEEWVPAEIEDYHSKFLDESLAFENIRDILSSDEGSEIDELEADYNAPEDYYDDVSSKPRIDKSILEESYQRSLDPRIEYLSKKLMANPLKFKSFVMKFEDCTFKRLFLQVIREIEEEQISEDDEF